MSDEHTAAVTFVGSWKVVAYWPPDALGGPQRVTIEPADGADQGQIARGITSTILRRINLDDAREAVTESARRDAESALAQLRAYPHVLGRRDDNRRYYGLLLGAVESLTAAGERGPATFIARELSEPKRPMPVETVRNRIKTARRLGIDPSDYATDKRKANRGKDR